jgi:hypothetical protein
LINPKQNFNIPNKTQLALLERNPVYPNHTSTSVATGAQKIHPSIDNIITKNGTIIYQKPGSAPITNANARLMQIRPDLAAQGSIVAVAPASASAQDAFTIGQRATLGKLPAGRASVSNAAKGKVAPSLAQQTPGKTKMQQTMDGLGADQKRSMEAAYNKAYDEALISRYSQASAVNRVQGVKINTPIKDRLASVGLEFGPGWSRLARNERVQLLDKLRYSTDGQLKALTADPGFQNYFRHIG